MPLERCASLLLQGRSRKSALTKSSETTQIARHSVRASLHSRAGCLPLSLALLSLSYSSIDENAAMSGKQADQVL